MDKCSQHAIHTSIKNKSPVVALHYFNRFHGGDIPIAILLQEIRLHYGPILYKK